MTLDVESGYYPGVKIVNSCATVPLKMIRVKGQYSWEWVGPRRDVPALVADEPPVAKLVYYDRNVAKEIEKMCKIDIRKISFK